MELIIKGTQEEITKLLQTIASSKEQSMELGSKKHEGGLAFLTEIKKEPIGLIQRLLNLVKYLLIITIFFLFLLISLSYPIVISLVALFLSVYSFSNC